MSEYQYYRFERLEGHLDRKAQQRLRNISSRADINTSCFQVEYHYSDLKAEPSEVMLQYFDVGFYYANWGLIEAYIKLPVETIPDAMHCFASDGLYVQQCDEWQLLTFSIEEYYAYFDDEDAENFFQHLSELRNELMRGNWRLLYFMWLKELDANDALDAIPLIQCDFEHLSEALLAFAALYTIPLARVKALSMALKAKPSHQATETELQFEAWLDNLTERDKTTLLSVVFEQGQLTRHQALAMTRKASANKDATYQHWLRPELIAPYIEQAQSLLQQEQDEALAKKLAIEKAERETVLTAIYSRREQCWQQAQEQVNRTCASAYDQASRYLHQLFEAYQLKGDTTAFSLRLKRFVAANNSRKALLNRLNDLL